MNLPTRAEFLATGLVPVQNKTDSCSICFAEPMDSPVETPCHHFFCKDCITKWLEQPTRSTCAMCRQAFFVKSEKDPPPAPDAARREMTTRALRASGLASISTIGTPFEDSAPFSAVETFDASIPLDRSLLMSSAARAFELITWDNVPRATGTARFQTAELATNLIAMANLLKHVAIQQGRPYPVDGNPWSQIVCAVWQILLPHHGMDVDALVVPGVVINRLRAKFAAEMDSSSVGLFFRDEAAARDLEILIAMLVLEANQQYLRDIGILRRRPVRAAPVSAPAPVQTAVHNAFSRVTARMHNFF